MRDVLVVWDAVPPGEVTLGRSIFLVIEVSSLSVPPPILVFPAASSPILVIRNVSPMEIVVYC